VKVLEGEVLHIAARHKPTNSASALLIAINGCCFVEQCNKQLCNLMMMQSVPVLDVSHFAQSLSA
jgi:hypothetical protein